MTTQKSESAFRTISEVADDLDVQQHVLRFWETKFGQIKPLKRGGGRRYYRPEDVALLRRIHTLLYVEGYTIKGVQKLLKGVSKSQVLEEQKKMQSAQAYGTNLPQVTPADDAAPVAASAAPAPEPYAQPVSASGFTAEQKAALEHILAELMDMRAELDALTGDKKEASAA